MILLAIETSTSVCSVALIRDGQIISSEGISVEFGHSTPLAGMAKKILEDADTGIDRLDGVGVSIGPGSVTGLRIGLAFAKGICSAASIPIVAVPTLMGLAHNISEIGVLIRPIVQAKKGKFHTALYEFKSNLYLEIEPHEIISSEFLNNEIFTRTILIGGGNSITESKSIAKMYEFHIDNNSAIAEGIARLGEKMYIKGEYANIAEVEPDYKMEFKAKKWNQERSSA